MQDTTEGTDLDIPELYEVLLRHYKRSVGKQLFVAGGIFHRLRLCWCVLIFWIKSLGSSVSYNVFNQAVSPGAVRKYSCDSGRLIHARMMYQDPESKGLTTPTSGVFFAQKLLYIW